MEKVIVRRRSSQAKVLGTAVSIAGAFVVTLYKGAPIIKASLSSSTVQLNQSLASSPTQNWVLGGFFLTYSNYEGVPSFFYNIVVCIIAAFVALVTEGTSPTAWILKPNVALASVVCSGFGSCLNNSVHTWALRIKGPVFVAMFKPLSIAIAVAMGVMFLGDTLYLGSVIGAVVISIGFTL